jgi:ribosomal protein S18 acetylase RimI-like enzyme
MQSMNLIWPAKFNMERFDALYRIYVDSIPAAERKPDWMIRAMWERADYSFGLAEIEKQIVGFSILFTGLNEDQTPDFYLLEYFAIDSRFRNRGIGGELFRQTIDAAGKDLGAAPLLIEVESDRVASEQEQAISRKRIEFYRRLGCKRIMGLNYLLPLKWPVPPMELMVRTEEDSVSPVTLRRWLGTIYFRVYRRDTNDPRIEQMLAGAGDHFVLE